MLVHFVDALPAVVLATAGVSGLFRPAGICGCFLFWSRYIRFGHSSNTGTGNLPQQETSKINLVIDYCVAPPFFFLPTFLFTKPEVVIEGGRVACFVIVLCACTTNQTVQICSWQFLPCRRFVPVQFSEGFFVAVQNLDSLSHILPPPPPCFFFFL